MNASTLSRYEINRDHCTMCDKCREVCKDFAIEGRSWCRAKRDSRPTGSGRSAAPTAGNASRSAPKARIYINEVITVADAEPEKPVRHVVGTCPV